MTDNFQVETFDKKSDRDARWDELRKRVNAAGTIGRRGLVRFSMGKAVTVREVIKIPGRAYPKLGKKGPRCGYTLGTAAVDNFVPTWAIAYPRPLSPERKKARHIQCGPSPKRRRRARYFRRHPKLFHVSQSSLSR